MEVIKTVGLRKVDILIGKVPYLSFEYDVYSGKLDIPLLYSCIRKVRYSGISKQEVKKFFTKYLYIANDICKIITWLSITTRKPIIIIYCEGSSKDVGIEYKNAYTIKINIPKIEE